MTPPQPEAPHAEYAAYYIGLGLALTSLNGKVPEGKGWQNTPFTDPKKAVQFWLEYPQKNMGVVLNCSPVVTLDVDHPDHASQALAAVDIDLAALLGDSNRVELQGKPGRAKLMFARPDSFDLKTVKLTWPDSSGNPQTVFELRGSPPGGKGFQDVLPPSIHPDTGKPYVWIRAPWEGEGLPELPPSLLTLWRYWPDLEDSLRRPCVYYKPRKPATPKEAPKDASDWVEIKDAYNERHPLADVLETHGYERRGDRYLAPGSESGLAGVVVLGEVVFSHHGSDKLADGKPHDAYDITRILEHNGDQSAAYKAAKQELGLREDTPQSSAEGSKGETRKEDDDQAQIVVNGRYMHQVTDESLAALVAANTPPTLFVRGGALTRVRSGTAEVINTPALKGILDRTAKYVKLGRQSGKDGNPQDVPVPARPPADVPPDILSLPALPFPSLAGISNVPVFLPDGTLLDESGYNPDSGLLLDLTGLGEVYSDMTTDEAKKHLMDDVYGEFPFACKAGKAHTLALTLEPFVRPLIAGPTPLYAVDAPTPGTGKGLLIRVAGLIATGKSLEVMALAREEAEVEKRITAMAVAGCPLVLIDNVREAIDSESLAAVLTSEVWRGRILGKSEMINVPMQTTWIVTGNNLAMSDEIARRTIPIRLDRQEERPEDYIPKNPGLAAYTLEHRPLLVSACLSLVRRWVGAGMPRATATLGSYEAWAAVMGGILDTAGVPDFLGGREALRADADRDTAEWRALCLSWWDVYNTQAITAGQLLELATERTLAPSVWGGRGKLSGQQRLGRALQYRRDRVYGDLVIRSAGFDGATRNKAYRLESSRQKQQGSDKTPETPGNTQNADPEDSAAAGVSRVFRANTAQTPGKHPANTRTANADQNGNSEGGAGVSSVSGVCSGQPHAWGDGDRPPLDYSEADLEQTDEGDWHEHRRS